MPSTRSLEELARAVGGEVRGEPALPIGGVGGLGDAKPGQIAFYNNPRYREALQATKASAVVTNADSLPLLDGRPAILVGDPYLAFAQISTIFHPRPTFPPGVDPRAVVEPGASIDPGATVMALAYVGAEATVGAGAILFPGAFVGPRARVGAGVIVYPNVVIREGCVIGDGSILQPGAVIGADGFGFAPDVANGRHFKIPQAGVVVVEDDVEVGANSAIDRATLGETRIGRGTKIDNLVQVGHNVQVGPLCILCGQVGLAGSAKLGAGVICAGQAGVANHLHIADGTRIGPQSGVMSDIEQPGEYLGHPAVHARDQMRNLVAFGRGAETLKRLQRLEKRLEELEAALPKNG